MDVSWLKIMNRVSKKELNVFFYLVLLTIIFLFNWVNFRHSWYDASVGAIEALMLREGRELYSGLVIQQPPFAFILTYLLGLPGDKFLSAALYIQFGCYVITPALLLYLSFIARLRMFSTLCLTGAALSLTGFPLWNIYHITTYTTLAAALLFIVCALAFIAENKKLNLNLPIIIATFLCAFTNQYYLPLCLPVAAVALSAKTDKTDKTEARSGSIAGLIVLGVLSIFLIFFFWTNIPDAIDILVASSYANISKHASNPLQSLIEPVISAGKMNFGEWIKQGHFFALALWFNFFLFLDSLRSKVPSRLMQGTQAALLFSLLILSRHYGFSRTITLCGPLFLFLFFLTAIEFEKTQKKSFQYSMNVICAFILFSFSLKSIKTAMDTAYWVEVDFHRNEKVLMQKEYAKVFSDAAAVLNNHRSCMIVSAGIKYPSMYIIGRGNWIYYLVDAIPAWKYTILEDTLLQKKHFDEVLDKVRLIPSGKCIARFGFGNLNSNTETEFRASLEKILESHFKLVDRAEGLKIYMRK